MQPAAQASAPAAHKPLLPHSALQSPSAKQSTHAPANNSTGISHKISGLQSAQQSVQFTISEQALFIHSSDSSVPPNSSQLPSTKAQPGQSNTHSGGPDPESTTIVPVMPIPACGSH